MLVPKLYDQGRVTVSGAAPTRVQGRSVLYSNLTSWETDRGDVLGPFYLFSYNARGGAQLYLYLRANNEWYLYTTGINTPYMEEWKRRVGWRGGIVSQSALNAMGLDLRDRVARAVEGTLASEQRQADVARQEDKAQRSVPRSGVPRAGAAPSAGQQQMAGVLPTWVRPVGAAAAVILGAMWWGQRGKKRRRRR